MGVYFLGKSLSFQQYDISLWHKVDISTFRYHKSVNFCNDFVGLTVALGNFDFFMCQEKNKLDQLIDA